MEAFGKTIQDATRCYLPALGRPRSNGSVLASAVPQDFAGRVGFAPRLGGPMSRSPIAASSLALALAGWPRWRYFDGVSPSACQLPARLLRFRRRASSCSAARDRHAAIEPFRTEYALPLILPQIAAVAGDLVRACLLDPADIGPATRFSVRWRCLA